MNCQISDNIYKFLTKKININKSNNKNDNENNKEFDKSSNKLSNSNNNLNEIENDKLVLIDSDIHNETAFSKKLMMGNQTQQTILHG